MKNIKDYNLEDLKNILIELGEKPFRAEQIFKWIYQEKVTSFDEMTNLSIELREKLKENYSICTFNIIKKLESKTDGTKKYLFDILDGNAIESVLMKYHHGYSVCVSTQVGCKMGCKFCASTGIKFIRSLTAGEIVEQILRQDIYSRNNDVYLIFKYITKVYPYETGRKFEEVMSNVSKKGLSFESITRARRKLQNKYPELKNEKIANFRNKKQKEYIAYSRKN